MTLKRSWLATALLNFVLVALLGLLLRWQFVDPISGLNFKFFLHAHSHVALLGWLYLAILVVLLYAYLPAQLCGKKMYAWLFWLAQAAVLGMLLSFPVQGYALFSITFSTLHILFSYGFIFVFLKDARRSELVQWQHKFSFKFIKAALFFMALSSLGPWAMGPIMATGNSFTPVYYNAIYFYLHFQYNGWFTFAILGLFFWLLEHYQVTFNLQKATLFFRLMFWAALPAYLLSVLWTQPHFSVYLIAGIAAFAQLFGLVILVNILHPVWPQLREKFSNWSIALLGFSALAFVLKIVMQAATAFPYMADLAYKIRHLIIGYLHLVLIGFISLFLLAFFIQQSWLSLKSWLSGFGLTAFLTAFVLSEGLLFLQGLMFWMRAGALPHYDQLLFAISVFLPLGLILFSIPQIEFSNSNEFPAEQFSSDFQKKS
ncbi:MAG: hypothetical protein LPK19_16715 [Hymenobacteraceae bacterium]|nr:hypothetical protein [Hymenobacteraceae bacterium]MDX5397896.1 hypothetical protein [Hymenobacteraceae bacterium]MDX5513967.1 hypothetical protein [Hymenobacteraceae bacterium]